MIQMYMFVVLNILNAHNKDNITSRLMKHQCYVINHVQQIMDLTDYIIYKTKKISVQINQHVMKQKTINSEHQVH